MTFWSYIPKPSKVIIILLVLCTFLQAPVPTLVVVVAVSVLLEIMARHLHRDNRYEKVER